MISVIIPCYNSAKFVHRAINSVLNQTYADWELILINNNSTDRTKDILLSYSSRYPNKITVFDEFKKGACAARNKGLYKAKGTWIQFLDADDELVLDKLERQFALTRDFTGDLIIGNFVRRFLIMGNSIYFKKLFYSLNIWKALITARLGITSANLFRKQAILKINGWDESLSSSQEYELMFRLLKNNSDVGFDTAKNSAFIFYEQNSITRNNNKEHNIEAINNYIKLRLSIKEYLLNNNLLTRDIEQTIDEYIYSYLVSKRLIIPEYVRKMMHSLNLKVRLSYKILTLARFSLKFGLSIMTKL